ncbi:hypothetical protein CC80DRAFT_484328 [Byssothecium circinans]|uniref:Uncharacterized protein n=1 Tax=Byssothecium circinans TaxID=147558 RepID=A0A6A5TA15_9PLEO|nr:hypothetical protein CC80DRAFT_484328 [Byssothecium circinans]
MVSNESYNMVKAKASKIKELFQTRHYIQCVALCERILIRNHAQASTAIHPVHLAYIHFYLASSHDTMAREATLRHRCSELNLAEKHYHAALTALLSQQPEAVLEHSPTSQVSDDELAPQVRRESDASQQSLASSATSLDDHDYQSSHRNTNYIKDFSRPNNTNQSSTRKRPAPIYTPDAALSYQHEQFSADLSVFRGMIRNHLQNVRELKAATVVPSVRFTFELPSRTSMGPPTGDAWDWYQAEMESMRAARKRLSFRPRFDPSDVQKLCTEVLCELRR